VNKPRRSQPKLLSQLAGKTIADALAKQGFAQTGLVTHWADIVGADIADHAEPMADDLAAPACTRTIPSPATLVLRVRRTVALRSSTCPCRHHRQGEPVFRLAAPVGRIQIRQAPLMRRNAKKKPRGPDPAVVARLAAGMTDVTDEGLRDALARLGASIKRG